MNKGRRQELKNLKYKRRLKNLGLLHLSEFKVPNKNAVETCAIKANLNSYRTSGKPCSCFMCSPYKYNRAKEKVRVERLAPYS